MGKYTCNKEVFKTIETEEEAYWLGFILADGCNIDNQMIRVDIKDANHLEKLSDLIYNGEKPIHTRDLGFGPVYCFHCGVLDVVHNLNEHGVVPRKSKIAKLPIIKDDMYRHFIRGLFDGDGSLSFSMDKNYRRYTFSIVGNQELIMGVRDILLKEVPINVSHGKMKMIYRLYVKGNQQIMTLLDWLYQGSKIHLDRKFDKFQEMLYYYREKNNK
jgi:intein/homing endonuclease